MKKSIPALPVENIEQSVAFYQNRFGFNCPHQDAGFAILIRDEMELHLWSANDESWKMRGAALTTQPISSSAESFLAGTASCRIQVQGIDELYEEYKQQGILYNENTVLEEKPWGHREFPALDHHRNLLTFYEEM